MRAYARQAKNKQLEVDAAEIRIRSERRLGEMLAQQKETVGLAPGGRPKKTPSRREEVSQPALAEVGIDHKLSSRAQKLAAVPEREFEADVAEWREKVAAEGERVTTKLVHKGELAPDDLADFQAECLANTYMDGAGVWRLVTDTEEER